LSNYLSELNGFERPQMAAMRMNAVSRCRNHVEDRSRDSQTGLAFNHFGFHRLQSSHRSSPPTFPCPISILIHPHVPGPSLRRGIVSDRLREDSGESRPGSRGLAYACAYIIGDNTPGYHMYPPPSIYICIHF
jgi:hypothetical protein